MSDKPCGCSLKYAHVRQEGSLFDIEYCPLHAAAPKLLAACEAALFHLPTWDPVTNPTRKMVEDAIAAAKEAK